MTLYHLHLRFPARMVWSDGGLTGVRFAQSLPATDMSMLRGPVGGSVAPEPPIHLGLKEMS